MNKKLMDLDCWLSMAALCGLLITIVIQVILRFVFSKPLMGADELTRYFVICTVMIPLGFIERSGSTVVMTEIRDMFPKKLQSVLKFLSEIGTTAIYLVVLFSTIDVLINNSNNQTSFLKMPFWLYFLPMLIGMGAMSAVRIVMHVCKVLRRNLPWASQ